MPTFEKQYANPDVSSPEALYRAFIDAGVLDAVFTLNGGLNVKTETGTEAQCDAAVASAAAGTLTSNKTDRILQIRARTQELQALGVEIWTPGVYAPLNHDAAGRYYSEWQYLSLNAGRLTSNTPYVVYTLDGRAATTRLLADIKTLADNAADRLAYLYTAALNLDGSKGEIPLISALAAAGDQTALDAIVDSRA